MQEPAQDKGEDITVFQICFIKMGKIKSVEKILAGGILTLNTVKFLTLNSEKRLCKAPCDCWEATMTAMNGLQER